MVSLVAQSRRPGFDPWVVKILWRREWLPTPVFLPGEFHDHGGLHSPWGYRVRHHWATDPFTFFHFLWQGCRSMVTQWCPMCLCMVHHYLQHQTDCMLISQIRFPTSLSRKPKSISMISIILGPEFLISEFLIHIEFQWMASTSCTKPIGGEMLIVPLQKWDSSSLFLGVYKWFQPTVNQSLSAQVCGLAGMQRSGSQPRLWKLVLHSNAPMNPFGSSNAHPMISISCGASLS